MTKKLTKSTKSTKKNFESLINPNSFFEANITCRSPFDLSIVKLIEQDSKSSELDFQSNFLSMQKNVLGKMLSKNPKKYDASILRSCLFYLIIAMDHLSDNMEELMTTQMIALQINDMYVMILDEFVDTDRDFVIDELNHCLTFQTSQDCSTPNILKENFLEVSQSPAILEYVKANFVNVNYDQPEDFDFEKDQQAKEIATRLCAQFETALEEIEKSQKVKKISKPKIKKVK